MLRKYDLLLQLFLFLHNVFFRLHLIETDSVFGWRDYLWNVGRIVTRMIHDECLLGTFWFLKELFFGNVFFYAVLRLLKRNKLMTVVTLFLVTVLFTIMGWRVPYFGIRQTTFYASTFIAFGCFCRDFVCECKKWWCYLIAIASIAVYVCCFDNISMDGQTIATLVPYTVSAIGGSLIVFAISDFLNEGLSMVTVRGGAAVSWQSHAGNHGASLPEFQTCESFYYQDLLLAD